jgi:antitoxin component YwqK of YwqJK toxin-antitoxin module
MKKVILSIVVVFFVSAGFAQEVVQNKYKVKGDLIEATLYHDNGEIAQTGFYTKENKLQGEWFSYDVNGAKTAVAYYENGKKVGTWKFFTGDIIKEVTYTDAAIAKVTTMEIKNTQVVSNK